MSASDSPPRELNDKLSRGDGTFLAWLALVVGLACWSLDAEPLGRVTAHGVSQNLRGHASYGCAAAVGVALAMWSLRRGGRSAGVALIALLANVGLVCFEVYRLCSPLVGAAPVVG